MKYFVLLLFTFQAGAETILKCAPTVKTFCNIEGCAKSVLSEEDTRKNRVQIDKNGARFEWVTKEDKSLTHSVSGMWSVFVEPGGFGLVRVLTGAGRGITGKKKSTYLETLYLGLGQITYFGECDRFDL